MRTSNSSRNHSHWLWLLKALALLAQDPCHSSSSVCLSHSLAPHPLRLGQFLAMGQQLACPVR